MVYFNCGACGEALKKNQVEKHYLTQCRNCHMVSCFDCGTEFWGDDYQKHIKCISEEEKYSGKNFVPKVNKGEAKQEQWIEQVQCAIEKCKCNPNVKKLLVSLLDYPNIPRKKIKFENFLGNSLRIRDKYLVSQVWDILMVDSKPTNKEQSNSVEKPEQNGSLENSVVNGEDNKSEKKLNKRERKEERQKKKSKKDKKHKNVEEEETDQCLVEEKTKKKKCDNNVEECDKTMTNGENDKSRKSKKKRKKCDEDDENDCDGSEKKRKRNEEDEEDKEEEIAPKKKTKFNWEEVITEVLRSKGELSLKRLRKKVLSEFAAQGQFASSEEKLWSKFNKKVTKNPMFKVAKDRVKLAS